MEDFYPNDLNDVSDYTSGDEPDEFPKTNRFWPTYIAFKQFTPKDPFAYLNHSTICFSKFFPTVLRRFVQIAGPQVINKINKKCVMSLRTKYYTYLSRACFSPKNGDSEKFMDGFSSSKRKCFLLHPEMPDKFILRNVVVKKIFFAENLPVGYITKLIDYDWHFHAKSIVIDKSTLNHDELFALLAYGRDVNKFTAVRSTFTEPLMVKDLAFFLRRAHHIDLDLNGLVLNKGWIKCFHNRGPLTFLRIRNVLLNFTVEDLHIFMNRLVYNAYIHFYLAKDAFPNWKAKTVIKHVKQFLTGFKQVTKSVWSQDYRAQPGLIISFFNKRTGYRGIYFVFVKHEL